MYRQVRARVRTIGVWCSSRTPFLPEHGNERPDTRIGIGTDGAEPMYGSGDARCRAMQAGDDTEHVACSTTDAIAAPAYTMTARVLHWLTAFLILAMIPLGVVIANEWGGSLQESFYDLHRSLGAVLILIVVARLVWRWISKAVSWGPSVQIREEEDEDGRRVKVITSAVSLIPSDRLDEDTAAAIAAVSQSSTGTLSIKMHDKLAALVALGKHLGMFERSLCSEDYTTGPTPKGAAL
jgi:Prokaryotic cytochrome b561